LTRSCAKKLQHVTSLLTEFDNNIIENIILPKSYTLVIIRFKHQGYDDPRELMLGEHAKKSQCQAWTTNIRQPSG
jgi:hypothetical protein